MPKYMTWLTVIVVAGGLGVAAGSGAWMTLSGLAAGNWTGPIGPSMMQHHGPMMSGQFMNAPRGERLSIDRAIELAQRYSTQRGQNLMVAEVMEFSNNFYVVIHETDTGRGAFEILLDPYTGAVFAEPGPNMMWNAKYGHMGIGVGDNTLTLEQAHAAAQTWLDTNVPGATAHEDGMVFYGYYTFDYDHNGQIAGMLGVHGVSGEVWPHTWHGQFIAEKEMEE